MASDATAAFTGDAVSHVTAALNARAISVSRFSNFEEKERAVKKYPFPAFYVKGFQAGDEDVEYQKVKYHMENRFEAKSSYAGHKTSGLVME